MKDTIIEFQDTVWAYYGQHKRNLPWRRADSGGDFDAYHVLVSEYMLQQTQVSRVVPKYETFLDLFPTVQALATAPLASVLTTWSGLGYNRRAKFLWLASQEITNNHNGAVPQTVEELTALPGIGSNTAAAILVYAYNQPHDFIETNIRTVFIHHFFPEQDHVDDKLLQPIIMRSLDHKNPREWYWALMDYGSYLKTTEGNISRRSKQYTIQTKFAGSRRQIRGAIIRLLTLRSATFQELQKTIADNRLEEVLKDLMREGFIERRNEEYRLHSTL